MPERQNFKVSVLTKDVYGSLTADKKYEDDTVVEVITWLQETLETIPPEFRECAKLDVDSVGGYEGEHHTEVEIYYIRPETDQEMAQRIDQRRQYLEGEAARHASYFADAKRRLTEL